MYMYKSCNVIACLLPIGALVASCEVAPPAEVNAKYAEMIEQRKNNYRIKDGDTVALKIYENDTDLNQASLLVLPDGRTDALFMDNYQLSGKTVAEVEQEYRRRIGTELLGAGTTEISIQVKPRGEKVHMIGEFVKPGSFDMTTGMTLHEAIALAQGLKVTGDTDWALLRRPIRDAAHPDLFRIDLNDDTEDIFLLPGDQIVLGRTWLATVIVYLREYFFTLIAGGGSGVFQYAGFAGF